MKEQLVKISETIYLIFLPADVHNFNVQAEHLIYREGKLKLWKYFKIGLDFKIHGTCTLPLFDFDFEVTDKMASCSSSCSQSDYHKGGKCDRNGCYGKGKKGMFANKIQKAIQDEGMFVVNPVKLMDGKNISCEEEAEAYHKNMTAFVEAETKTVKKLLLIEKI